MRLNLKILLTAIALGLLAGSIAVYAYRSVARAEPVQETVCPDPEQKPLLHIECLAQKMREIEMRIEHVKVRIAHLEALLAATREEEVAKEPMRKVISLLQGQVRRDTELLIRGWALIRHLASLNHDKFGPRGPSVLSTTREPGKKVYDF